mmetsp:Transcript_48547/g.152261  ORF Transcript_48547/g.152261 Transcript_48547/m.152261 type:complete len:221 (+) Transcript_48547:1874-2536(+)
MRNRAARSRKAQDATVRSWQRSATPPLLLSAARSLPEILLLESLGFSMARKSSRERESLKTSSKIEVSTSTVSTWCCGDTMPSLFRSFPSRCRGLEVLGVRRRREGWRVFSRELPLVKYPFLLTLEEKCNRFRNCIDELFGDLVEASPSCAAILSTPPSLLGNVCFSSSQSEGVREDAKICGKSSRSGLSRDELASSSSSSAFRVPSNSRSCKVPKMPIE